MEASPLTNEKRSGRWKRPLEAIVRSLIRRAASPATLSKYNLKFISQSEDLKDKRNQVGYPAALNSKPSSRPAAKEKVRDKKKTKVGLASHDEHGIWGPGINLEVERDPRASLLSFVLRKIKIPRKKSGKSSKKVNPPLPRPLSVPPVPPVSIPKKPEVDSYLMAFDESRIPCRSLEDPTDCDDFSLLFKPSWYPQSYEPKDPAGNHVLPSSSFYKEYSSPLANFIDPSQLKLVQPSADTDDFLLQKPILFLSPNIKFTIFHHSTPNIGSLDHEIALPSVEVLMDAELSSIDSTSAESLVEGESPFRSSVEGESSSLRSSDESQSPSHDSLVDSSSFDQLIDTLGLNMVGPLSAMNVAPVPAWVAGGRNFCMFCL